MKKTCSTLSGVLTILLFLFTVPFANATTRTSNAVIGLWNVTGSWALGVVPLSTDDVTIVAGANISLAGNTTCANLTINSSGTLTGAGKTLTVTVTFNNYGTFTSGSGNAMTFSAVPCYNYGTIAVVVGKNFSFTSGSFTNEGTLTIGSSPNFSTATFDFQTYPNIIVFSNSSSFNLPDIRGI